MGVDSVCAVTGHCGVLVWFGLGYEFPSTVGRCAGEPEQVARTFCDNNLSK